MNRAFTYRTDPKDSTRYNGLFAVQGQRIWAVVSYTNGNPAKYKTIKGAERAAKRCLAIVENA